MNRAFPLIAALALGAAADAKPKKGWETTPYFEPILSATAALVGGQSVVQTQAGGIVGLQYLYRKPRPWWAGRSRLRAVGIYAPISGSLGTDVRLGSFIGPDWKVVQLQHGPDLWFDMYGTPGSPDYHLPPTIGVDIRNQLLVRILPELSWITAVSPGWVSNPARQADLGPIHTLDMSTVMAIQTEFATLQVGVRRTWTSAGPVTGLILTGGL
ncbi:MAG: hypothetical protein KC912_19635 [Proteobacteria bacterium]|nr:hypothetical protein [Pseudomonadota bacterium]